MNLLGNNLEKQIVSPKTPSLKKKALIGDVIPNNYSYEEKCGYALKIKDIKFETIEEEMNKLIELRENIKLLPERCLLGNSIIDYFTFIERLETKGKYNANFYDFLYNIEYFKTKKFIQTILVFYKDKKYKNNELKFNENIIKIYKETYNICISSINIMKPLNCMEIYLNYKAQRILNFCAGWGGSLVAACALNLPVYYGIEINTNLKPAYEKMTKYLATKCITKMDIYFCDALNIDYTKLDYDCVFSSPPYYNKEKYSNNNYYKTKKQMNEEFYTPIFKKTFDGLKNNGYYIINICREVYIDVLVPLLGEAHFITILKKSKKQNNYKEYVYCWHKKSI